MGQSTWGLISRVSSRTYRLDFLPSPQKMRDKWRKKRMRRLKRKRRKMRARSKEMTNTYPHLYRILMENISQALISGLVELDYSKLEDVKYNRTFALESNHTTYVKYCAERLV